MESDWIGTRVRKGKRLGKVTQDWNGYLRTLTVKMDDGATEKIVMNNVGEDPVEVHQWEWQTESDDELVWYRF